MPAHPQIPSVCPILADRLKDWEKTETAQVSQMPVPPPPFLWLSVWAREILIGGSARAEKIQTLGNKVSALQCI